MADNPDKSLPTEGKSGSNQDIVLPSMSSAEDIVNRAREEIEKTMENAMANQQGGQEFEEIVEYIDPIQDPYGKAIKYLEQHDILQLFQALTANIVYFKPDDPLSYMMKEIEVIKKEKASTKSTEKK
ncbi:uncharacterized protein LOC111130044 [Crassostrea virginica]|uniref:Uncharacterized protein LOC111129183 n=1 Tax=Crassostrea virginica TaxID=6565 RepID=A0A8B8DU09_CRAVI|nr:uncharacterized protein LOC111129183 [Crassostrea virginica]XP_022332399.1 uncharacterized protein LOC111130044 [Crassostrea virginica]